jgi:hypothetical protein
LTNIRKTLRTYRFMDKDPVKDELQTILQDEGLFGKGKKLGQVATLANLSPQTLDNLFFGDTRRPQNATVMAIITAVGYQRKFVKERKLNVEAELEFARAWNKKEEARLAKARATEPKKRRKRKTA